MPATGVAPGPVKVNVAALIVAGFMASLNVAEIAVLTATAVAPFAGTVETTVAGGSRREGPHKVGRQRGAVQDFSRRS